MGFLDKLFGAKTRINVGSTTTPLIGTAPDLLGKAIMQVIYNDENLTERLVDDALNGMGIKVRRAYRYARDHYTYGLPSGYTEYTNFSETAIRAVLTAIEGEDVTLTGVQLDYADTGMHAFQYAYNTYGWDYLTDELSSPPATLVLDANNMAYSTHETNLMNTLAGTVPADSTTSGTYDNGTHWRETITYSVTTSATLNSSSIDYYIGDLTAENYDLATQLLSQTAEVTATVTTSYSGTLTTDKKTVLELWAASSDPLVDAPATTSETHNYSYLTDTMRQTDVLLDSVSWTKQVDLKDYYYFVTYTTASGARKVWTYRVDDSTYPSLAFGTSVSSGSPFYPVVVFRKDNQDYFSASRAGTELYETSVALIRKLGLSATDIATAINENPDVGEIDNAFLVFATRLHTDNKAGIQYLARFWDRMATQFGSSAITQEDDTLLFFSANKGGFRITESALDLRINWADIKREDVVGKLGVLNTAEREVFGSYIEFRWQNTETTYKRIQVFNPSLTNYVYQGHTTETNMDESDAFIIPLHAGIVDEMGSLSRNELYYDSLQLVFNSYTITKEKWYQTSLFRAILTAVTIYLIFTSPMAANFVAALEAGAYQAAAMILVEAAITAYVMQVGFKFLVKALGIENSWIVALIAVAIAAYDLGANGWSFENAAWAENLLMAASGISTGISANLSDQFKDLQEEWSLFNEEAEKKLDALKEAQDLLTVDGLLDPMEFIYSEPMINFNEYPSDYYERTIHSGNTGTLGFTIMENYTDIMLQLPKPNYGI